MPVLEAWLEREVASVATAFEVCSSRWNGSRGACEAMLLLREGVAFTGIAGDSAGGSGNGGDAEEVDLKSVLFQIDEDLGKLVVGTLHFLPDNLPD